VRSQVSFKTPMISTILNFTQPARWADLALRARRPRTLGLSPQGSPLDESEELFFTLNKSRLG
jgi:hypothetical protein